MKNTYEYKRFYFLFSFTVLSVFSFGQKYTGLTAIASDGTTPTVIFDGNTAGGRWQDASNTDAAWITINLGSVKNINSIKIYWEAANAKAYNILASTDNTNWTSIATKTNMAAGDRADIISGLNADCQYVKIQGVTRQLGYGYSIYEFEVYPTVSAVLTTLSVTPASTSIFAGASKQFSVAGFDQVGVSYALTNTTTWSVSGSGASIDANGLLSTTTKGLYTVTATNSGVSQSTTIDVLPSGTNLSYVAGVSTTATAASGTASFAFDNNSGSRWESAQSDPQWIKVDLGGNKTVTDIHLTWETANAKNYIVEASADNTNWTTVITKTNMVAGSRTDRLYDVNFTARYVRLTGTVRTTDYGYSIWEFKIFGSSLITPNLTFATPTSLTKNYGDAAFTNSASSSNSVGAITYSSGNTSVATVDSNTGQVTINAAGTAIITAMIAANGSYSSTTATYTLTVNGIDPNLTFATPTSVTKNYGDATFTNSASSSNSAGSISYSSGNTSVATINSSTGEVTIVAAGAAVITTTIASNGSYNSTSVSYTLTVTGVSPDFSFSTSGTINKKLGDAVFTNAASSSNSAGSISYSSDNASVATVNSSTGQITIAGVGTAVITASLAANGGYTAQSAAYTLIVKYPIGSIKGSSVPLYAQGSAGGDINTPINTSLIDYKVVTKNGKSWIYTKFTGSSALDLGAAWTTQFRYWTAANAKTENNLTVSRDATSKVVLGTATSTIPNPVRISFFQNLIAGGFCETLLTSYSPTTSNSPVAEDVTAPAVSACDAIATETSVTLKIAGSDNSGDLFYHIEDASHSIDEFAFEGTYNLPGLTLGTTYNLSITPIDFTGNEGSAFSKQFTCSSTVNIASNIATSAISSCPTCSFTVASGAELTVDAATTLQNITAAPGAKISVQSGKTLTAGTLNLNSDASGTATFVDNGTSTITTANVQQYMTSGRNWYISSPISNATTNSLSSSTSIVYYDEPTATWKNPTEGSTLNTLLGYISATTKTDGAITFSGALNTGAKSISLSRTPAVAKSGFNLLGNPYPSFLNWDLAYAASTNLESSIWFRTKTKEASSVYTFDTYNAAGAVGTNNNLNGAVTKFIPPMQAFWVRVATGKTSGTLALTNSMRSHNDISSNKFRAPAEANSEQQVLRLEVSNGTNSDETIILFNHNASNGFDDYDSPKMTNANAVIPEIYTLVGTEQLVINGLNNIIPDTELLLGFNTGQSNTFTIKATEIQNFDASAKIILKDNALNTEQELTDNNVYSFSSDVVNSANRFSLIFKSPSITTAVNETNEDQKVTIYQNSNNQIVINCKNKITGESYVTIYNTLGQEIEKLQLTDRVTDLHTPLCSGIYLVKVSIGGKSISQKIILNK